MFPWVKAMKVSGEVDRWKGRAPAENEGSIAPLEQDAQLLEEVSDGGRLWGSRLSRHGTGDAADLGVCILVPSSKCFHWEGDEK